MSERGLFAPETGRIPPGLRLAGVAAGVAMSVLILAIALWPRSSNENAPSATTPIEPQWVRPAVSDLGLIQSIGVRVMRVAATGGGGLLDLRFQVLDPEKAAAIHDLDTPPAILDEETGVLASELYMGHSHTAQFRTGVTYYLVFENPGDLVQRGDLVTVLLGPVQVEHLLVD